MPSLALTIVMGIATVIAVFASILLAEEHGLLRTNQALRRRVKVTAQIASGAFGLLCLFNILVRTFA